MREFTLCHFVVVVDVRLSKTLPYLFFPDPLLYRRHVDTKEESRNPYYPRGQDTIPVMFRVLKKCSH